MHVSKIPKKYCAKAAKVHEPASQPVLKRPGTGVQGGYRACGGGRKHRPHGGQQRTAQGWCPIAGDEAVVAQAIDDEEHAHRPCAKLFRRQDLELAITIACRR